ncbi:MAG: short-chain dehydrogenase [Acidobacteria bacterium]|nr:MAG: short-chain dehydrogenase [Acidobacteriota bacterium]
MRLKNRVAVVTGGASGIGRATALRFSGEGASVAIFERNSAGGEEVCREITHHGRKASFVQTDIAVEEQVREAIHRTEAEFGAIHILVNNAAAFVFGSYDVAQEDWQRVLSVNVMGTATCSKYAVETMIRAGGGAIVNVTSISGLIAQDRSLPYNTSKAALLGLNRCLAMDLARHNIRVNAVAPGWIDTPQLRVDIELAGMTYEQSLQQNGPLHLLNRFGTADEVANAILFLASEEASFITGTCLMVDGGYIAK